MDQDDEFDCILGRVGLDKIQCASPGVSLELLGIGRTSIVSLEGIYRELRTGEDSYIPIILLFILPMYSVYLRAVVVSLLFIPWEGFIPGWHLFEGGYINLHTVMSGTGIAQKRLSIIAVNVICGCQVYSTTCTCLDKQNCQNVSPM